MKQIVITIQVPDGVSVNVSGGATTSNDRPFVPQDAPPRPAGGCEVHDVAWRLVPAGVSRKTGKPYNAFWACPEQGCNERPPRNAPVNMVDVSASSGAPDEDELPF